MNEVREEIAGLVVSILHAIYVEQPNQFAAEARRRRISREQLAAAAISEAVLERLGPPQADGS